jgi:N-acetylmuramoyl-L-alanine amidase
VPRGNIRAEIARRLILSASVLVRLALFCFFLLLVSQILVIAARAARAADAVSAVRVWPAQDYTRVTLESLRPIRHTLLAVKNPERLVLDLEGMEFTGVQKEIAGKVVASDPYVMNLRAGRYAPGVVRLVLDLKQEVKPQIFLLKPVGEYGHRLVLDIYPVQPIDPLMALLDKPEAKAQAEPAAAAKPDLQFVQPEASVAVLQTTKAAPKDISKPETIARLITIALDAGHGGEDPGARGRGGSREKHVTLTIARKLKTIIDGEPNMRAVLTRDADYYIPLRTRVEKARRVKSDLFVSIHADAFVRPHASGSSVFALSERGATSVAAGWLAKRENAADLIGGVNLGAKDRYLAQTLLDLSQTATIQDSLKVARSVLSEIGDVNRLHKQKVEQAGFAVLKAPDIPSILVETAFISNPDEERRLNDDAYQDKMAQALFRGIKRYFAKNPPLSRSTVASLQ